MSDVYAYWRACLANGGKAPADVTYLPTYHGNGGHEEPQPGIYRTRTRKGGPLVPVRIWLVDADNRPTHVFDDGLKLAGTIGGKAVASDLLADRWMWCEPVSKAALAHYDEHGRWPEEAPTIGDNAEKAGVGPLELLRDYMETARAWFGKIGKIDNQQKVDQAANYAAELAKLKTEADRERDAQVRPHLEAQREINGQYKPTIDDASALGMEIKRSCDAYLIAEKRRLEDEARAKYEAERRAAELERARIEAERAKQMRDDPIAALTEPEPELPMPPPPPAPVKVQAGGQRGRKVGLKKFTIYEIADYQAVVAWAAERAEVVEYIEKIARQAMKSGETVPGMTTRIEERAA